MTEQSQYICAGGETWDIAALKLYGSEALAYELLIANPALCHLSRFSGGERLNVPIIVAQEDSTDEGGAPVNAPWR